MALKPLKAIGLMSGTSLDGIDVAFLETDGEAIQEFGASYFRPYSQGEREIIERSTQAALKWNFKGPPPNIFAQAQDIVDQAHIEAVQTFMQENQIEPEDVDIIGYHGQTILHRPPVGGKKGQTLQIGNGKVIAKKTGIKTIYDFRTNDMQNGGQGAPLAPVFHKALVQRSNLKGLTCVLNIGGVSNMTLVFDTGSMMASDCGPGNGPLDSWIAQKDASSFDKDGQFSLAGTPRIDLIDKWLQRDFFHKPVPKSADRWDFDVLNDMSKMSVENGAATLVAFTAESIKHTLKYSEQPIDNVIVCGGGRRNPTILSALREQGIGSIKTAEDVGWMGDDIEAQAFAFLAVRHVHDLPLSFPGTTGVSKPVTGGRSAKP